MFPPKRCHGGGLTARFIGDGFAGGGVGAHAVLGFR